MLEERCSPVPPAQGRSPGSDKGRRWPAPPVSSSMPQRPRRPTEDALGLDVGGWRARSQSAALMYASGATLVAVSVVLSSGSGINRAGILSICLVSATAAIGIYALGPRYSLALSHASSATGSILVCIAVALAGGTSLSFLCGMLLVWVALYGAVFYQPKVALGHIWLGSVAHAMALGTLPAGARWAPWLLTAGTCHVVLFSYRLIDRLSRRLRAIVEHSGGVVLVLDGDHHVKLVGGAPERVLDCSGEELLGRSILDRIHPDDRPHVIRTMSSAVADGTSRTMEVRLLRDDAVWIHADVTVADASDDPSLDGIVVTIRDVTERKLLEEQLTYQAFHDPLTGLPNRALFAEHVERALKQRRAGHFALLFLDLDDFKRVNDTFGHSEGDALLRAVADRLRAVIRDGDIAARLGGDEFAVLLGGPLGADEVRSVTERILDAMRAPAALGNRDVHIGASAGVVADPDETASVEEVLRNADLALYAAKNGGKGRAEHFRTAMHRELVERVDLEAELRRAVDEHQLAVHYQPIIELASGQVTAVEALLRWQHPTRGLLSAAHFVPLAEDTGSIRHLGRWVLEQACGDIERLTTSIPVDVSVSVNVSGIQLQDPSFAEEVQEALRRSGLQPERLLLEITESILLEHLDRVGEVLADIRSHGTRVAIDDFGTGYSSLAHLRRLPVDVLKVAREFTAELGDGPDGSRVTSTIVNLGHSLGLRVVAEGVEQREQAEQLERIGCDDAQGFFFARPAPLDELRLGAPAPALPSHDRDGQAVGAGP
jgi:diguanylate cyclase (GGDEF)-like protein/PAS domain S-box-containing protein